MNGRIAAVFAVWVIAACDPEGDGADARNVVIEPVDTVAEDDGGGEGSTGGQAEAEFEEGEAQVCAVVEGVPLAMPVDDVAAEGHDPLAATVPCPFWGVGVASYTDYRCEYNSYNGAADLYCQYWCDCTVDYKSPCDPPHADCGERHTSSSIVEVYVGTAPWGMWQCQSTAPVHCRLNAQKGADACASACKWNAPKRTRECPDCPK